MLVRLVKSEAQNVSSQQNIKRIGSVDISNAWYLLKFHSDKHLCELVQLFLFF